MPDNSIQEIYKQIKDTRSSANGEDYQKYLQAMERLNTELHGLMEPGLDGWKLLDAERIKALAECYREAGEWAEVYLYKTRETKDPAEQQLRGKVTQLQELMAADTAAFRHYNPRTPAEMKSLPTVLEEARIPVMDQGSKQIKSVGGAQSSRIPMTIIGPAVRQRPG